MYKDITETVKFKEGDTHTIFKRNAENRIGINAHK